MGAIPTWDNVSLRVIREKSLRPAIVDTVRMYDSGRSIAEIAEILGKKPKAIYARLRQAERVLGLRRTVRNPQGRPQQFPLPGGSP